ncbi:hypothetical protein NP493_56g06003 [Ridgeia piscesae]|uniref:Uncharacterized protein n=1 Tax=Ridgeia piscesae TaxID=27915 RepID=A0AAD9PB26_RIDPI|nr:hypothetical protein NP493_56g06003 [Ridgeia piscesae]
METDDTYESGFQAIQVESLPPSATAQTRYEDVSARDRYEKKLEYGDGAGKLLDPYLMQIGWQNDPSLWPDLTFCNIYQYLINMPGMFSRESMKANKSLDAYSFAVSGHVEEVKYMDITNMPFCLMKSKVIPSMRIRDKPHELWVYLVKETAEVYCAHCTCMAGLGEVGSHDAALLFKMEIAVKMGLTKTSSTSEACKWNASFRKQLEPLTLQEMAETGLLRGNRKRPVASSYPSGRATKPSAEVLNSFHDVCPNAAFFTS